MYNHRNIHTLDTKSDEQHQVMTPNAIDRIHNSAINLTPVTSDPVAEPCHIRDRDQPDSAETSPDSRNPPHRACVPALSMSDPPGILLNAPDRDSLPVQ